MNVPYKTPLQTTLAEVEERTRAIVESVIEGSIAYFKEEGEVPPAIIALPEEGKPKVFGAAHHNYQEKQLVWSMLRLIRSMHPITLLVTEVWYSHVKKGEQGSDYIPPSKDPDRKETVLVQVWEYDRDIMIAADISRNPNHLGEFFTVSDSKHVSKESKLAGELQTGPRCPRKEGNEGYRRNAPFD